MQAREARVGEGDAQPVDVGEGGAVGGPERVVLAENAASLEVSGEVRAAGARQDVWQMLARWHEPVDAGALEQLDRLALVRADARAERRGDVAERQDERAEPQRQRRREERWHRRAHAFGQ